MRRTLGLLLAATLLVTACGSSDESSTTTAGEAPSSSEAEAETTTTAAAETTTTTAAAETTTTTAAEEATTTTGAEAGAATADLTIVDFAFGEPLTVAAGTEVTATNEDSVPHTWTASDGTFDSGNIGQGESFSFTFDEAGTYDFVCTIHPTMTGSITVTEDGSAAAPALTVHIFVDQDGVDTFDSPDEAIDVAGQFADRTVAAIPVEAAVG